MEKKIRIPLAVRETVQQAQIDINQNGSSVDRLQFWADKLRAVMTGEYFSVSPKKIVSRVIEPRLRRIFKDYVERGEVFKRHLGVSRMGVEAIKPYLRQELDSRIRANIDLIVLERDESIKLSALRQSKWLLNAPQGQLPAYEDLKYIVSPAVNAQKNYEHSRRSIDQGHKLLSAIDSIIAKGEGAIAGKWHSHKKTPTYDARPEHVKLDGNIYVIRNSWAVEQGLVKKGDLDWLENIVQPAHEINCTCYFTYYYEHELPKLAREKPEVITQKGREYLNGK